MLSLISANNIVLHFQSVVWFYDKPGPLSVKALFSVCTSSEDNILDTLVLKKSDKTYILLLFLIQYIRKRFAKQLSILSNEDCAVLIIKLFPQVNYASEK